MKKFCHLFSWLLFTGFCFSCPRAVAQERSAGADSFIDVSSIRLKKDLRPYLSSVYIRKDQSFPQVADTIHFRPGVQHTALIPTDYVSRKLLLRFQVTNSSDTNVVVYFFSGFYFPSFQLYTVKKGVVSEIPGIEPDHPDSAGFRELTIHPGDSTTIYAEMTLLKTYLDRINPRLIYPGYIEPFINEIRYNVAKNDLMTFVFCGLLLMMVLLSFTNFIQGANHEFLYYSAYAFFLGGMLLVKALFDYHTNRLSYFIEAYFDFILQGLGHMFYMIFMQKFLDTRRRYPFLFKLYNAGIILILVSLSSYSALHYFSDNYTAEYLVENTTKILLLGLTLVFLVYSVRQWNDKLIRFLFWGNLFLFLFALISQIAVMYESSFRHLPGILSSSLFYYEVGLLLELFFFLLGLNYKNRRKLIDQTKEREALKAQNLLKEYEKEIAVYKAQQEERQRISADMHDELGAGMTAIRLMSEIARNKMKENTPAEIDRISQSANDVLNKMNAIIWSMNSQNDSLDNFISYVRAYAFEYFDGTAVQCSVSTPDKIPSQELTGDKRRNLFLAIKETLNNVLKHAQATAVRIDIRAAENSLLIEVADNGKGIDIQNTRRFGNGLKNIERRLQSIGGQFTIENKNGTVSTFQLPL